MTIAPSAADSHLLRGSGDGTPSVACVMGDMDLVRPLALAGIPCAVVAAPASATRFSRFTGAVIEATFDDPEQVLIDALLAFAAGQPVAPVLYFEDDWQLLFVSRNRERLAEGFRFVVAQPETIEDLMDKDRFRTLAERLGLPVPRSARIRPADGSAARDVDLDFPLIIKPLPGRTPAWRRLAPSAKAIRVAGPGDLATLWPQLERLELELLVQELVPGPESRIESYHVYVDASGAIAGEFTGRKLRTLPVEYGHSTALTTTDAADVREQGRDVVMRLDLRGVAKLDFKRAATGELRLLEVNPRFNLWHHLGAVAGVNIPAIVHADLTVRPRPPTTTARAGVNWSLPWRDARAARQSGLSAARWLRWMVACEAKSGFAWDDPMPFVRATLSPWLSRQLRRRETRGLARARRS